MNTLTVITQFDLNGHNQNSDWIYHFNTTILDPDLTVDPRAEKPTCSTPRSHHGAYCFHTHGRRHVQVRNMERRHKRRCHSEMSEVKHEKWHEYTRTKSHTDNDMWHEQTQSWSVEKWQRGHLTHHGGVDGLKERVFLLPRHWQRQLINSAQLKVH